MADMKETSMAETPSRRRFLRMTAAAGLVAGCGTPATGSEPEPFGTVTAGNVSELTVGTLQMVPGAPAYIGRDAHGLYAMTSTCTHEGCDMISQGSVDAAGVYCACHGSRFDANGAVLQGPATVALAHFKVSVDANGSITVEGGSQVSASVRLAVA